MNYLLFSCIVYEIGIPLKVYTETSTSVGKKRQIHSLKNYFVNTAVWKHCMIFLSLRFYVNSILYILKDFILPQCRNFRIFLSLKFYVKPIFAILEILNFDILVQIGLLKVQKSIKIKIQSL